MINLRSIGSGFAGALVLTAIHETARRQSSRAPRMDVLASRAIAGSIKASGYRSPSDERLHQTAFAGDVASNTLYYSLVGAGDAEGAPRRGAMLGLAAGLGTVVLPPLIGLGREPSNRTKSTQAMTVAWYTLGGIAAGVAYQLMAEDNWGCCR